MRVVVLLKTCSVQGNVVLPSQNKFCPTGRKYWGEKKEKNKKEAKN